MTRRGELNTTWTLPSNAVLTLSEKDEIAELAARVLGDEWVACGFGDSPPAMSSAVVRIVFQAIKDILTRQGRLVPTMNLTEDERVDLLGEINWQLESDHKCLAEVSRRELLKMTAALVALIEESEQC